MQSYSYENDFDLHENETTGGAHFLNNGFALRLVLKQTHNRTRKWPIKYFVAEINIMSATYYDNKGKTFARPLVWEDG